MKKRVLSAFLAVLMVLTLLPVSVLGSPAEEECSFYLEFVSPDEPGCYVNWDGQVKWNGYSHFVNLYHKVEQDYIPVDPDSVSSSDPGIVSVEYCSADKYQIGKVGYYFIRQLSVGTATLSYTYTAGGQQYRASYEYTVEYKSKLFYMNTDLNVGYTGFGFQTDTDDWSMMKRYGLRFYDGCDNSVILGEDAIQFPEGAGTFTYRGDGYWDWDPTNAVAGVYHVTYTHEGRTQYVVCNVDAQADEDEYSGDLMFVREFGYYYYTGFGRGKGQNIKGICFYKDADYKTRIIGQEGFDFPEDGGTFTYMGDGMWNWDSSTGTIGDYKVRYSADGETYSMPLYIMDDIVSVEQFSSQLRAEHNGGRWIGPDGADASADTPGAWYWYSVPGHGDTLFDVTLTSGTTRTMTMRDIHEEFGIWPEYGGEDPQYETHWTRGHTYTVTLYFGDVPCSFEVQLNENPFASIEPVAYQVFAPYTNGWWCDANGAETDASAPDAWYYYQPFYYDTLYLSVKLKGQTEARTMTVWDLFETYGIWPQYEDTQSSETQWCPGNTYPVELSFGDVSCTLRVRIKSGGNINGDGTVDVQDLQCLYTFLSAGKNESSWGDEPFRAEADCNGDGAVNILDYQALYEIVKK